MKDPAGLQRLREFHPRFADATDVAIATATFRLSDAQMTIAREYGFADWPNVREYIESGARTLALPYHERISDPDFRAAVDFIDSGALDDLRRQLEARPQLVTQRVTFPGGNYFSNPSLLEFVAENPTRNGRLPANIVESAKAIIEAGAKDDRASLNATLALVASSKVARERGAQTALLELLCEHGADPAGGILPALLYRESRAVETLLRLGAPKTLLVAAAAGAEDDARQLLVGADDTTVQQALSLAAQYGNVEIVEMLLDAGADPNRYAPPGGHSHATPLHQAALAGYEDVARLLVMRGARTDLKDILYGGTAEDWAQRGGHTTIVEGLRSIIDVPANPG